MQENADNPNQLDESAPVLTIVYVSSAVYLFTEAELKALLEQCRKKNFALGITGVLLYKEGSIMQAIEGPHEVVKKLARTIYADKRHKSIIQLVERTIPKREFPDWLMEFRDLSQTKMQGAAIFMENHPGTALLSGVEDLSPIVKLLAGFGQV